LAEAIAWLSLKHQNFFAAIFCLGKLKTIALPLDGF
jgi:hypothetical protein